MKSFLLAALFLLASLNAFAQTYKPYNGEEYMPYIFEPYSANYSVDLKSYVGTSSFMPTTSTIQISESEKEWEEIERFYVGFMGNQAEFLNLLSKIEIKTGLLNKFVYSLIESNKLITTEINFSGNQILLSQKKIDKNGKVISDNSYTINSKEKYYPCYTPAMWSYLPYSENFAAEFNCFFPELFGDKNLKPVLWTAKLRVKAAGSEIVSNSAGMFNCYKLETVIEKTGYYDEQGVFHTTDEILRADKKSKERVSFVKNRKVLVDKKTRKFIKEATAEGGTSLDIEILPDPKKL